VCQWGLGLALPDCSSLSSLFCLSLIRISNLHFYEDPRTHEQWPELQRTYYTHRYMMRPEHNAGRTAELAPPNGSIDRSNARHVRSKRGTNQIRRISRILGGYAWRFHGCTFGSSSLKVSTLRLCSFPCARRSPFGREDRSTRGWSRSVAGGGKGSDVMDARRRPARSRWAGARNNAALCAGDARTR
jgi:hypothetical protein